MPRKARAIGVELEKKGEGTREIGLCSLWGPNGCYASYLTMGDSCGDVVSPVEGTFI